MNARGRTQFVPTAKRTENFTFSVLFYKTLGDCQQPSSVLFLKTPKNLSCWKVFCGAFFQKSDIKSLHKLTPQHRFFFWHKRRKRKSFAKRKRRFMGRCPKPRRRNIAFAHNVTQASLSREGDRVSGGRSFSWHRVIKFYTARVLLQSRPAPAPSRREPFIKPTLSHT